MPARQRANGQRFDKQGPLVAAYRHAGAIVVVEGWRWLGWAFGGHGKGATLPPILSGTAVVYQA